MPPDSAPVTIAVPGTCGELVQGWYSPWEEAVLVSCPIAQYSRVSVRLCSEPNIEVPNGYFKMQQAARLLLDSLGRTDLGATVYVESRLPPGRGMGSSTADVVAVSVGLARALGVTLAPAELARLACRVEPSDSTMFAGLALLAYRTSRQAEELGAVPSLPLLLLDPGETIDTVTYNAHLDLSVVRKLAATTEAALDMLRHGLAKNDPVVIGAAATLSATSYQAINFNELLPMVQRWARATRALGLVRAHSGSVLGLLYPPNTDLAEPARWLAPRFDGLITQTHLTGGGYRVVEATELSQCSFEDLERRTTP